MIISFDLDGTLYDTLPLIFGVDKKIRKEFNYPEITLKQYKTNFQSKDWIKFYRDLGIREDDIQQVLNTFQEEYKKTNPSTLIPGAKEAILEAEKKIGKSNIYFITNGVIEKVKFVFERDGLENFVSQIETPFEGKKNELLKLASLNSSAPLIYIGDLVSDGEACIEAKKMGANNIIFYGLTHKYSFNTKQAITKFVEKNRDVSKTLKNISEISTILKTEYNLH